MQTPIYETSIYTYKSPLGLNPDDVIAYQDSGSTITIGINTIADYDKYYITTDTPSFGETFVSLDVGTIDDAIASNSRGTSLSQQIINDLTIVTAGLGVTGYRKYEPLISSSNIYLGETFIPKINITNSILDTRVLNKLYINSSTLYAPLYRVMTNKITKVMYNYAYKLRYYPYYGGEYSYKDPYFIPETDLILNLPDYRSAINPQTGGVYKYSLSVPTGIPWTFENAARKRLVDGAYLSENWSRVQLSNGTVGPLNHIRAYDVWTSYGHKYEKHHGTDWARDIGAVGRFERLYMKWFITKTVNDTNWSASPRQTLINRGRTITSDYMYVRSFLRAQLLSGNGAGTDINTYAEQEYDYVWNYGVGQSSGNGDSANGTLDQWTPRKQYFLPVTWLGVKYVIAEIPQQVMVYSGSSYSYSQVMLYTLNDNNVVTDRKSVGLWAGTLIPVEAPAIPFFKNWLPDIPYYGGNYGYGELPQTVLNAQENALNPTVFKYKWCDGTYQNYNNTYAVNRGSFTFFQNTSDPTIITGALRVGPSAASPISLTIFNLAKQQATDYGLNDPTFKIDDSFFNQENKSWSFRTVGGSNFDNYKVQPVQLTIKAAWSNGQVTTEYQSTISDFPNPISSTEHVTLMPGGTSNRNGTVETYVERTTTGNVSIPLNVSNFVNSTTQAVNIRNFDNISGGGVSATDVIGSGGTVTLATAGTVQSVYESSALQGITSSSATSVGYYVSFASDLNSPDPEKSSRKVQTAYTFGTGDQGTTFTYVNNVALNPKGEIKIINPGYVARTVDVTSFVNDLYVGSNFDITRTFGFTLQSNQLKATRNNYGISFPTTQIASPLNNWRLTLDYNSITEPSAGNFFTNTNNSHGFSGPSSHNVVFTFNSSGQCLNNAVDGTTTSGQIITRQVEEQIIPVYEKFDVVSTAENVWKHGTEIQVPDFNADLLGILGITPTYPPYKMDDTVLRINASFVGNGLEPLNPVANDPFQGHFFDIPFNSGATLIDAATQDDLKNISNQETKTLDLKSYFGLLKTESILPQYISNSFDVSQQKIVYLGYSFPPDFYAESIQGSSLYLVYRWGTDSKYTQYNETYLLNQAGATISILNNLTPESSILSGFVRSDRERLFLSQPPGTSNLHMTAVRTNPAGYTFTEVRFPVTSYGGGDIRYKIYRSEEKIESGTQIQQIFDINNNSIGRTASTPIIFRKSVNPIIPSKFIDAGIAYTMSGNELRSISISKTPSSSALVNNFLVIEDTSTTYKNTGSMYLFVTPDQIALSGPIIPAGVKDYFFMPEYEGTTLGGKTGIPTFGPTLQSLSTWAINSAGDYIITNNLGGAESAINTSETAVTVPFGQIDGRNSIQAAGFRVKSYTYNYFETLTGGETGTKLYAIPFNWNENPNGTYNIAYGNNYITLNYLAVNGENANGGWVPYENRSNYPIIVSKPLYVDMTFDLTKYYNDAYPGKSITGVRLYLYKDNKIIYPFENVSGNTYTARITDLQDSTIYGDFGNLYQISGTLVANNSKYNIRQYTTRRFYIPDGLFLVDSHIFTTTSYVQDPTTKLTKQTITFNFNSGGEIRYEGIAISPGVEHRFAVVLDGVPETEFILDPAVGAAVRVNFLKPNTTYTVSLRYYPYANDPDSRLHDLSEVKPTEFSFTTPVGSELTANISINPQTINDRIYDTIINNVQLIETNHGSVDIKDISLIDLVFESQSPTMKIYGDRTSSYKTFTVASGFSQPIALQLKQLIRGKYYYPFVYLKYGDYYSNLVKVPSFQVKIRDDITSKLTSTSFSYNKLVTFDHLDIYDSFLVEDYSTPSNEYGYLRIVNDPTDTGGILGLVQYYASLNLADYADRKYPSSGVTLLIDKQLDKSTGVTLNFLKTYYSPYKPYDEGPNPALTIAADSTGKVPHVFGQLDKIEDLKTLFTELTGFSLSGITLGDDSILYGDTVLCAYSGVGATGVLSIDFLANDNGIAQLVETFYGLDPTLTFYDPNNLYVGIQNIIKSTDRIDLFGNIGWNQYLESSTVPSNSAFGLPGGCTLTYAQGSAYKGINYSFDTAVISLKPLNTVINIHYIANQVGSLTDYIGIKVKYTAYECIYNGIVLEVSNPDDIASKVCVFRGDFPNERDGNNTPHPDLDYMFSVFKHFRDDLGYKFYFQTIAQVDSWNSSLVSNYWWTEDRAKPLLSCPFRILNRYIELVKIPPVVIPPTSLGDEKMDGVISASPALYYGSVNVTAFNYYKGDSVNNSYPIVYNPTRLLLRQVSGPILATANIDATQPSYQDITFVLGSTMLSPNTTYNMLLVFQYNSGSGWFTGTATRAFEYKVPADQSNFDNLTQLIGIHKARVQVGNSIFGNKSLNDINKQQQLTLYARSQFNYQGEWSDTTGYTLLDAVTYPDLGGTKRLYWLRDISRYKQTLEPYFLAGWEDTSTYINFTNTTPLSKNDVFLWDNILYKTGNDGVTLAPGTVDKNINRYPDYDTNILTSKSYPFDSGSEVIFDKLIPDMTYDLNFKIAGGNTYGPREYYGDYNIATYKTLPSVVECKGYEGTSTNVVFSNVSYKNTTSFFRTGVLNYNWGVVNPLYGVNNNYLFNGVTCTFPYNGSDTPVLDNVYVTYTPQNLLEVTGMEDQTDIYRPLVTISSSCTVEVIQPFYNMVRVSVTDYNPKDILGTAAGLKFIPSPSDSLIILKNGVYWQSIPLINATFRYRLYDATGNSDFLQTADIDLTFSITGLNDKTTYSDFTIAYRVQGTNPITGTIQSVPTFTTTPKLSITLDAGLGGGIATCTIQKITYCDVLYSSGSSLFPYSNPKNKLIMRFQTSESIGTIKPFMSADQTTSNSSVLPVRINSALPPSSENPSNYTFNQIYIEYTAANISGVLETLIITSSGSLKINNRVVKNLNLIA